MMIAKQERVWVKYLVVGAVIVFLLAWLAGRTFGQTIPANQVSSTAASVSVDQVEAKASGPLFTNYKGVKIGSTADEVKKLFDEKPKSDDGSTLLFDLSDGEMVQIGLDGDKKVRLISAMFIGEKVEAPTYDSVFGPAVPVKEMSDGRVYNLIEYPGAGYWVAYSKTAPGSDDRMIAVTIQKIGN